MVWCVGRSNQSARVQQICMKTDRRKTPTGDASPYDLMCCNWMSADNHMHQDFDLYSSLADALADRNAWQYCNYDDPGVGFPRDCGPHQDDAGGGNWNNMGWITSGAGAPTYIDEKASAAAHQ